MQTGMLQHLGALLFTAEDKELDGEVIRHCHKLIKSEAGVLSYFRGSLAVGMATLLSLSQNPQQLLQRALEVYSMMKKNRRLYPLRLFVHSGLSNRNRRRAGQIRRCY